MSASKQRIRSQSEAAGFPLSSVVVLGAASAIVVAREPEQQVAAEAWLANTFDWSDAGELAWTQGKLRDAAAAAVSALDTLGAVVRAIAVLSTDQFNLLRGQFVGGAQAVWDPASIANGAGLTSPAVTVTGAAFGDAVDVSAPYSLQGLVATGYVSAADTVVVRLHNSTGGAVNLASGQWRVGVRRPQSLAQLQYGDVKAAIINAATAGTGD